MPTVSEAPSHPVIVLKFGGTSVEDARAMKTVIDIVRRERRGRCLVVLSAVAGATNILLDSAHRARDGALEEALENLTSLLIRHVALAENLLDDRPTVQQLIMQFKRRFEELQNLCRGISLLGELTPRSLDAIASVGELLSTAILAEGLSAQGCTTTLVDARRVMITDGQFGCAAPLVETIRTRAAAEFHPRLEAGDVVVTQGFIGATESGVTTTLGRGGSDYSAALFGAALDAAEIQIWTDVDGVLTADPRIVEVAHTLRVISFREASELAYFGAKVLHPNTILPAIEKNIPVVVLNAKRPASTGTRIVAEPPPSNIPVKSIASKRGVTVLNIQSMRMLMAFGYLESIFAVFSRHRTPVDLVSTSEVAVSLTIDTTTHLDDIVADLAKFAQVTVLPSMAILSIVGDGMQSTAGAAKRIFLALGDIEAVMVSQGASEVNMSLVVREDVVSEAVRRLHREFFEPMPVHAIFDTTPA